MFRFYAWDNLVNNWTPVLSGQLTHRWEDTEPNPLPIEELELNKVVETQFVKFEILSYYGNRGGLEYFDIVRPQADVYPAFSLVELLHYCALMGRELQSGEIFSCTERSYYRRP